MSDKSKDYPAGWKQFAHLLKEERDWKCERCGHPHDLETGHVLTVHHLTGNKQQSFSDRWAFAVLCQRCHLRIQGRVKMDQLFMLEVIPVSGWFKPHYEGYLKSLRHCCGRCGEVLKTGTDMCGLCAEDLR